MFLYIFQCCANVEAFIDFSEEENIEAGVVEQGPNFNIICT